MGLQCKYVAKIANGLNPAGGELMLGSSKSATAIDGDKKLTGPTGVHKIWARRLFHAQDLKLWERLKKYSFNH